MSIINPGSTWTETGDSELMFPTRVENPWPTAPLKQDIGGLTLSIQYPEGPHEKSRICG